MYNDTINWLLNTGNPAVQYRTKTELLGLEDDPEEAFLWIRQKLPDDWYRTKGLWYVYYVNALAECGLDGSGMPSEWFEAAMDRIRGGFGSECGSFDFTCESFMLLQALVSLGFGEKPDIRRVFAMLPDNRLPDGGFLCKMRRNR